MKFSSLFSVLCVLGEDIKETFDDAQFHMSADFISVDKVIPSATTDNINHMTPKFRGIDAPMGRRTQAECTFPLDVVIMQDATASFSDNMKEMKENQLEEMFENLVVTHPGSRFSVVSFRDKPIAHFGGKSDYCVKFDAGFTSDVSVLKEAYKTMKATGGMDPPENQFGAMIAALKGSKWNALNSEYARLIVLATDAGPHHAADGEFDSSVFVKSSGGWSEATDEHVCMKEYYPSYAQVKDAIFDAQTYIATLVYNGDWASGWPMKSWFTFNTYIEQTSDFIQDMDTNSSNFWFQLQKAITAMENIECVPSTTTTTEEVTTTTTPVTVADTTTTTPLTVADTTTTTPVTVADTTTTTPLTVADTTTTTPVTVAETTTTTPITAVDTTSTTPVTVVDTTTTTPATTTTTETVTMRTTTSEPSTATTTVVTTTRPHNTTEWEECGGHPSTLITDVPCVPNAENCYCQPEVLIEMLKKPDSMKLLVNGTELK